MATHEDLIAEMPQLEKMTIQERLEHTKKRRSQQLKRYQQYERDIVRRTKKLSSQQKGDSSPPPPSPDQRIPLIAFAANVQLLEAAARGDTEEVEAFLKAGVDPNTGNEDGLTALYQSCIDNREDMLRVLIDNGADVNIKDREMWTPLHAASTCGHKNLAAQLITRGATLLAINSDGNMPYDICEDEETLDYIESQMAAQGITQDQIDDLREVAPNQMLDDMKVIAEGGGDLEFRDDCGATPLHIAVSQGFEKVVEFLLESKKVDIHVRDDDGWQPIHAAACWAQSEIIQILVEHGADLDSRTNNNETPLMICEEDEIKSLIHQLKTENLKKDRNNLVRRSSSRKQQRSSIRRSSKRDKGVMRKMDAKGEAAFIQQSQEMPATNLDDLVPNGTPDENGDVNEDSASDRLPLPTDEDELATPDHVMIDEPLPVCRLSQIEDGPGDDQLTIEHVPPDAPPPEESEEVNEETGNNHSDMIEMKRPKSILKKMSSRVEVDGDLEGGGPKKSKAGKKATEKRASDMERSISLEQKQKEREEREREKQRIKSEKEEKKQREKAEKLREREEKQRRKKEEAAQRKQREKEQRPREKDQPEGGLNGASKLTDVDMDPTDEQNGTNAVAARQEGPEGPETLAALKRERQQRNSPIHSNTSSPDLSVASERSTDSVGSGVGVGEPTDIGGQEAADKPAIGNTAKQGGGGGSLFSRFQFSFGFMQSYNLQNPSSHAMQQKRNSVALGDPEETPDVVPVSGRDNNGTPPGGVIVRGEDGEPLKKFTAVGESTEGTDACCKVM